MTMTRPEVGYAQRIVTKYKLSPPIDIEKLIRNYANLEYQTIPIDDVDGVCINLKVPGKKPTVIVNPEVAPTRLNFTLAHELGHVIIPWHIGTIADNTDFFIFSNSDSYDEYHYRQQESEANHFAAELLMPSTWIKELYSKEKNLSELHQKITSVARVSPIAAAIQMTKALADPIVMCRSSIVGIVDLSGRTEGTFAQPPLLNSRVSGKSYKQSKDYFFKTFGSEKYHWWRFPINQTNEIEDAREWREILKEILNDIVADSDLVRFRNSLNGKISAVNSTVKRGPGYTKEKLEAAIRQRLDNDEYEEFTSHQAYEAFLKKRVEAFVDG